jgi:hypothetical protein
VPPGGAKQNLEVGAAERGDTTLRDDQIGALDAESGMNVAARVREKALMGRSAR